MNPLLCGQKLCLNPRSSLQLVLKIIGSVLSLWPIFFNISFELKTRAWNIFILNYMFPTTAVGRGQDACWKESLLGAWR